MPPACQRRLADAARFHGLPPRSDSPDAPALAELLFTDFRLPHAAHTGARLILRAAAHAHDLPARCPVRHRRRVELPPDARLMNERSPPERLIWRLLRPAPPIPGAPALV